jgi:uncharacterized protein (DUF427 family)
MCKYCECKVKYEGYEKEGAIIAEGQYSACCIIQYANSTEYYIAVAGDGDEFFQCSDPISFCPFCGRKLNE